MNGHLISAEYIKDHINIAHITYVWGKRTEPEFDGHTAQLPALTRNDVLDKCVKRFLQGNGYPIWYHELLDVSMFQTEAWDIWKDSIYGSCLQNLVTAGGKIYADACVNMCAVCAQYVDALSEIVKLPMKYATTDTTSESIIVYTPEAITSEGIYKHIADYCIRQNRHPKDYYDAENGQQRFAFDMSYIVSTIPSINSCIDYIKPMETPTLQVRQ